MAMASALCQASVDLGVEVAFCFCLRADLDRACLFLIGGVRFAKFRRIVSFIYLKRLEH